MPPTIQIKMLKTAYYKTKGIINLLFASTRISSKLTVLYFLYKRCTKAKENALTLYTNYNTCQSQSARYWINIGLSIGNTLLYNRLQHDQKYTLWKREIKIWKYP